MNKTIQTIAMATLCLFFKAQAQQPLRPPLKNQAIIGKVISATTGEALPGAIIKISNNNQTVLSNDKGEFILSLIKGNYNLSVYYLSHKAKTITLQVPLNKELIIALQTEDNDLKEVEINAGYYTVKEKERTGSISRITAQTISKQPVSNPLQALQSRMPGVIIAQQNGLAGGAFQVQIRGRNSIANGNDPLYIINGVPFISESLNSSAATVLQGKGNPLSSFNPSDIESIEVLKDADATAIYGSKGANGVILITTKAGKSGSTKADINVYSGVSTVTRKLSLLNTPQYLEMRKEAFTNDQRIPTAQNARDLTVWDQTRYTNWEEELIGGTASINNAQLSLSGGDGNTNFLFGTGYSRSTTVFPGNFSDTKISGNLNINHTAPNQKFKINITVNYNTERNRLPLTDITSYTLFMPPNTPEICTPDGKFNWGPANATFSNPYALLTGKYEVKTNNLIGNGVLSYQLTPGLLLKASLGYHTVQLDDIRANPQTAISPTSFMLPNANIGDRKQQSFIAEPAIVYDAALFKGKLNLLLGATLQQRTDEGKTLVATYNDDTFLGIPSAATSISASAPINSRYKYLGIFGRVNYNWQGKYLFNLTMRRDGSSRFGINSRFANFGAIGTAWVFSNEQFAKGLNWLSFGKLRASYGSSGNDQIPDYGYLDTWLPQYYPYQGVVGLSPARLANPNYGWEVNRKKEIALDLGFFNDRLMLSLAYYNSHSSSQLVGYPLAYTTGFSSIQANFPAVVQNTSTEISINSINFQRKNFKWSTGLNITVPASKLHSYPDLASSSYTYFYKVGYSMSMQSYLHYTGVNKETGIYAFQDVNENGNDTDDPDDYLFLKDTRQKVYGGLNNSFTFRNLDLSFFVSFVKQQGHNYFYGNAFMPGTQSNQASFILNRWQPTNTDARYMKFSSANQAAAYSYYRNSDAAISDASYIRLQNVSLSYTLNQKWFKKMKLNNCRLYMQGQNLWTITNYLGRDPESQGIYALPPLKTITAGLQITF